MRLLPLALKLVRAALGLVLLLLGVAGLFTLSGSLVDYPVVELAAAQGGGLARGAWHVHTTRSDGRGSPAEVAAAARAAGLHFVVLTDHNDFAPRAPEYVEGVLLVPGVEISSPHGHLAAFGLERALAPGRARAEPLAAVAEAGGASVLAHPVQERNPWRDPAGAREATGFELYSADTLLREALRRPFGRLLPALGAYLGQPLHGLLALVAEHPEATAALLSLGAEGRPPPVVLCAVDAHGLPAYEHVFRTLAMYVPAAGPPGAPLPADAAEAARHVVQALRGGQAFCAFRALGEPVPGLLEGLPASRSARVGDVVRLRVPAGLAGQVRLAVWGAGRLGPDGQSVELVAPGAVHVEAWAKAPARLLGSEWRPWLVPSPLRVVPREGGNW